MKAIAIEGTIRNSSGKKAAKEVRREDMVPCVVYGGEENVHFSAPMSAIRPLIYTPDFNTISVTVEGKTYSTIIKDFQSHPVTDSIMHVDFQELVPNRPIFTEIPVRLTGLAKGVKAGGKLMLKMRTLKVKALPENLVSEIKVDVTPLEVGKSVRVRSVNIEGIEVMNSPATPIASVDITRALRSAAAAAATAAAAAAKGAKKKK
ncbi:MAG: 50S ribosomal protein L25/general stress protein Ctc [Chitinophagales bacterium]